MYEDMERIIINLEDDSSSSESENDSDEYAANSSQDSDEMEGVEYLEENILD